MAYSRQEGHDIFISYAHDDDDVKWVVNFRKLLKLKLDKRLKVLEGGELTNKTSIWKDNSMPDSGSLNQELIETIQSSALFLVVMSECYLLSDWCKKELDCFIDSTAGNASNKVLIVEKEKTDRDDWPSGLRDSQGSTLLSLKFYEEVEGTDLFESIPLKTRQGEFDPIADKKTKHFATKIGSNLFNIKRSGSSVGTQNKVSIFFSLCPEGGGSNGYQDELKFELQKSEYITVLPEIIPYIFEKSLQERITECDLFIQILDKNKGLQLSEIPESCVIRQFNEIQNSDKVLLQWIDQDLNLEEVTDNAYKQFLTDLNTNKGGGISQNESWSEFKDRVQEHVNKLRDPGEDHSPVTSESIDIEVIYQADEEEAARHVSNEIDDRADSIGLPLLFMSPWEDVKPEEIQDIEDSSLGTVIIYVKDPASVKHCEREAIRKPNKVVRVVVCDPYPKKPMLLNLKKPIEIHSKADNVLKRQQIDTFLAELLFQLGLINSAELDKINKTPDEFEPLIQKIKIEDRAMQGQTFN